MDDENKKHKLTFKNIVFLSIFGLLIIVLKYYFTRSDACRDNCININSELIEYWKIELINYITHNGLKYKKFYDIYVKNGGERHYQTVLKWAKGEVIGPMSGKVLELINSYKSPKHLSTKQKLIKFLLTKYPAQIPPNPIP